VRKWEDYPKLDGLTNEIANEMTSYAKTMPVAISAEVDFEDGVFLGTGSLLSVERGIFLLTAKHVHDAACGRRMGIGTGPGKSKASAFIGDWSFAPEELDLALVEVPTDTVVDRSRILTLSDFGGTSSSEMQMMFMHGFPEFQASKRPSRVVYAQTLPYLTASTNCTDTDFTPTVHIAVDYRTSVRSISGADRKLEGRPKGMSGCLLWKVNYKSGEPWSPASATIAAVMHTYHQESNAFYGSRVEKVLDFLNAHLS